MSSVFNFSVQTRLPGTLARTGVMRTPHGDIRTPAFIVVGTKATVKAMTPEQTADAGAQAVLANAYHLYLQPGHQLIEKAGGLGRFMHWDGPTFTDSGGFQVLSLGSGFKKTLAMETNGLTADDVIAPTKARQAFIDDDGVEFVSYRDGSKHKFTPELSMQVQHAIGADITFAFDELTSLFDSYDYQVESLERRTEPWAKRSLAEVKRLREQYPDKPYQALFGVVQGAQYQDLRERAAQFLAERDFDGFGIGGAIEKSKLADIVRWCNQILPEGKPRHMLGISEPDDIFAAIEQGIDTFDCVSPTRVARNGSFYTPEGRKNIGRAEYTEDFTPLVPGCSCYACQHYTKAYLRHLERSHELLFNTLMSIHNEHFIIGLVDAIRSSIDDGSFMQMKKQWTVRYYGSARG